MEVKELHIPIPFDVFNKDVTLFVYPENASKLFLLSEEEALKNGESVHQILEGNSYDYTISDKKFKLDCLYSGIVTKRTSEPSSGRIVPNIYVGTLSLLITDTTQPDKEHKIALEVLATKFDTKLDKSYRENYRFMLKEITDKCTELLMQINAPIEQNFETDFSRGNETIYQRFSFINAIIQNKDFEEAIQKIIANPKTNWDVEQEVTDVRKIKRFTNAATKQLLSGSNRIPLQTNHPLYTIGIQSVPIKINSFRKIEHVDTPENRFIKHALEVFLRFAEDCQQYFKTNNYPRPAIEATNLVNKLDSYLSMSFFQDISRPTSLKLNSPVLQRKSGYREILSAWLQFDLASKLVWKGGDDVYKAGKRDIATLYEYWLFFTLYDLFKEKFKLNKIEHEENAYDHLLEPTRDGLNIMVKQGKHTALYGDFDAGSRKLKVKFSYNRSFKGGTKYSQEVAGSYTTTLRPDYTLSVWPAFLRENDAERDELIVHIHFDAKYKVVQFDYNIKIDSDLQEEEENNERKGYYKNADLLKMHAYKDAIRRTGGAYVLYPGTEKKEIRGFHEIMPGLGAFAINPSEFNKGINELSNFIDLVINHLVDRASQRENISNKAHLIYKEPKGDKNYLHEQLPEYLYGKKLIPNDTFVLVGYYKDQNHLDWIVKNRLYNVRYGHKYELNADEISSKYLLLYSKDQTTSNKFYKISANGPRVYTDIELINVLQYKTKPSQPMYLVYSIEAGIDKEFENININLDKLDELGANKRPKSISLEKLIKEAKV